MIGETFFITSSSSPILGAFFNSEINILFIDTEHLLFLNNESFA